MLRSFMALVFAALIWVPPSAFGAVARSCTELSRSALQMNIAEEVLRGSLQLQGKSPYKDNGGATRLEMRKAAQVSEDKIAQMQGRNADVAFLLVKSAGANDSPAISLAPIGPGGLSCFVRAGDTVLLRDGPSAHWTTVFSVDFVADVVKFVDPWPQQFPFLAANSGGAWSATLQPEGDAKLVVMPGVDVEKLLNAIVTVDDSAFAVRLAGAPCGCVTSDVAVRAIYDTLIDHGRRSDLVVAASLAGHVGGAVKSELAKSYDAAATFLAGAAGFNVDSSATDRFIDIVKSRGYESFKDISSAVLVRMYESTRSMKDPPDRFIKSAVTKASLADQFTKLERERVRIQTGRLYDAEGDVGAAIDEIKFVVIQLEELYAKALEVIKTDQNPTGWRRGVAESHAFETFRAFIDARSYVVSLYARNKNAKSAGRHFAALLAVEAPYPLQILARAAIEGCQADGHKDRVAALSSLDLTRSDAKAEIAKLACFPTN